VSVNTSDDCREITGILKVGFGQMQVTDVKKPERSLYFQISHCCLAESVSSFVFFVRGGVNEID
jgi:hypothetical protein